jgi:hypothetical protein
MTDESKIEYEPHDDTTFVRDDYHVHVYNEAHGVPDLIIWRRDGDEQFRLWGFQAQTGILVHVLHTDHKHPPDYPDGDCQKWSVYTDDPFPDMSAAPATPDAVRDIALEITDAPLADKTRDDGDGGDDGDDDPISGGVIGP